MSNKNLPLSGIKVLEMEGLAPTVYTGLVLADYGADVTIVNRPTMGAFGNDTNQTYQNRGKKSVCINFKKPEGIEQFKQLVAHYDVLIDCFRPGVLEKLGIGPEVLLKINPRFIICRITGYGQDGEFANLAGHDINYVSQTGFLSQFGKEGQPPSFPGNLLADFAGGGAMGVQGILLAVIQRQSTGKGQVVDVAMHEGLGYLSSFIDNSRNMGQWNLPRGKNLLDGGAHFYRCYETKDGQYMAVGSIEVKFFAGLLKGLGYQKEQIKKEIDEQFDISEWENKQKHFENLFKQKTRDEWTKIFMPLDCCVTPVLTIDEAKSSKLWRERGSLRNNFKEFGPHPKLSSMPKEINKIIPVPSRGQHTEEIFQKYGIKPKL